MHRHGENIEPGSSVFAVPFSAPFLETVARAILAGNLPRQRGSQPSQRELADITILVPTRRARRALQTAFLTVASKRALILPVIRPISETDEDLSLISTLGAPELEPWSEEPIPPAIDALERQLLLAELIQNWARVSEAEETQALAAPVQSIRLASDLARLMDLVETEAVPLDRLEALVPDSLSEHWQVTLSFLQVLVREWPKALAGRNRLSPADRRNRLIRAEAARIAGQPDSGPVIVAGVTGSIPATKDLMQAVLAHPRGAIVLPGLDLSLDDESYAAIRPADPRERHREHPQYGLAGLLQELGVPRAKVHRLEGTPRCVAPDMRAEILSETMRPAATTARWRTFGATADPGRIRAAMADISLITAPTALEEAEIIALIMRETLETPGRTAALVSPDRLLARRVGVRLRSWGIDVDDSAGRPLRKTPPGTLIDLALEAHATGHQPRAVVALLKHPLTRLGLTAGEIRRRARNLEIAAFRTVYLGTGIGGIHAALAKAEADATAPVKRRRERPVQLMQQADWANARDLVARLEHAFAPLQALVASDTPISLRACVTALIATVEALAEPPSEDAANGAAAGEADAQAHSDQASDNAAATDQGLALWRGEAGEAAAGMLARLLDPGLNVPEFDLDSFADFYRTLVATETVRPRTPVYPRLSIWGPYESRLQNPDVVILGGLNDGTWPDIGDTGPWLNRPMRNDIGLPQPEEAIGRSAHDFVEMCGAPKVFLTRAVKVDGAPTVPSRWLLRLETVLRSADVTDALAPTRPWLGWAAWRNRIGDHLPATAPEPRPPLALRPKQLSVTDVETWIANPYALYARKILLLDPLPLLGLDPDASLRGAIVHEAMSRFARAHPQTLPADVHAALVAEAETILRDYTGHPAVAAFWLPRFRRFAEWFAMTEPERRDGLIETRSEISGSRVVAGARATLKLTARADRIDIGRDGLAIYDYKGARGIDTLARRASRLQSPQLPLEAAIALDGGFQGVGLAGCALPVARLVYISTAGGEPAGKEQAIKFDTDIATAAEQALAGLIQLSDRYGDPATPYRAVRRSGFDYRYDAYAQLARVGEWGLGEDDGEDAA